MKQVNAIRKFEKLTRKHWNRKLIISMILISLALTIAIIIPTKVAYADQENKSTRLYKTIEIKSGDSLWSIAADNYTDECESMTDYIYLIKTCNSLYDDNITAGCHLIVPYYE